jgi:hypothetical protein
LPLGREFGHNDQQDADDSAKRHKCDTHMRRPIQTWWASQEHLKDWLVSLKVMSHSARLSHLLDSRFAEKIIRVGWPFGIITRGKARLLGKLDVLYVHCPKCGRAGRYRVQHLVEQRGRNAKLIDWLTKSPSIVRRSKHTI